MYGLLTHDLPYANQAMHENKASTMTVSPELRELSLAFLSGLIGSEVYRQRLIDYIKNHPYPGSFKVMATIRIANYTYLRDFAVECAKYESY